MLVGFNRLSIICTRVLRSTPGNNTSTDSTVPGTLSRSSKMGGWVGSNLPTNCGSLTSVYCYSLSFRSCANWLSNSVILARVALVLGSGVACIGLCTGCRCDEDEKWGLGCSGIGFWEVSWRITWSTISCSCKWRSSRMVLRLIGISDGERDKVWLCISLGWTGVIWGGDIVFEYSECPTWIRSLLAGLSLYWGVLGSGSWLLREGSLVSSTGILCWGSSCWP